MLQVNFAKKTKKFNFNQQFEKGVCESFLQETIFKK